jgi:adenylate kinase family enzyme
MLLAVVGPPGAGKSTVIAMLARAIAAPVFRLRETVRARPELLAGLAPSEDPLGWVSLEAVRRVLHTVFVEGRFAFAARVVLLDNFPGTASQLDLLAKVAAATVARTALLELRATPQTVVARVARRRVCLACGPDVHAPAVADPDDPSRCAACHGHLSQRDTDVPRLHGLRLARYTANQPAITEQAAERGIQHLIVDADRDLAEVCRTARHAVHHLIEPVNPQGSRP